MRWIQIGPRLLNLERICYVEFSDHRPKFWAVCYVGQRFEVQDTRMEGINAWPEPLRFVDDEAEELYRALRLLVDEDMERRLGRLREGEGA